MDTPAARRNILARIRAASGRAGQPQAVERDAVADYLARHPAGPRPSMSADKDALVARFAAEARLMSTTVDEVDTLDQVPKAVVRYLSAGGFAPGAVAPGAVAPGAVAPRAVAWRTFEALAWAAAGVTAEFRTPLDGDLVGITGCFCATAETGSIALVAGPGTDVSAALLPETHIAVVPASRIVAGHEEAFSLMRAELGELPRAVNFVSGPSRTGDIEQTIVLGAHGPYRVHAVIVRGV